MVYNGEVYNYKAICKQLAYVPQTTGDSEVLLAAFDRYGIEALQYFNGMFAIALYDQLAQQLYLIRDRIGIKPLLYYRKGDDVAFASEMKALLALNIDRTIYIPALQDYLYLEYTPERRSIFEDIYRLAPGHYLSISANGIREHQYYDLKQVALNKSTLSGEQAQEALTEKLFHARDLQLQSDVPLGAFLSGGVDSSLMLCGLSPEQVHQMRAYTIGFDHTPYDESMHARAVAGVLGIDHTVIPLTGQTAYAGIHQLTAHFDEPFAAHSNIPTLHLCQAARQQLTVAWSGDGGDELFMGYGYYRWYDRFSKLYRWGKSAGLGLASLLMRLGSERYQRAGRVLDVPHPSSGAWQHIWSQEQYMFNEKEVSSLLQRPYRHQSTLALWEDLNRMPLHPYERISLFDLYYYLPYNLLYKMDIASMAYGLEVRVPYLDHELVEFVLGLPMALRYNQEKPKPALKHILEQYLPPQMVHRPKWGFPAPMSRWLTGELAPLISEYLSRKRIVQQGLFHPETVHRLIQAFQSGKQMHNKRVWALIAFQLWYYRYVEPDA
jgi:asparagine synthase (glutamine-hydrolysing)